MCRPFEEKEKEPKKSGNAAFLLERGYCLGMAVDQCTRASVRLWRAAARQGNLEACLRVGDFYYYGRLNPNYF